MHQSSRTARPRCGQTRAGAIAQEQHLAHDALLAIARAGGGASSAYFRRVGAAVTPNSNTLPRVWPKAPAIREPRIEIVRRHRRSAGRRGGRVPS